MEMTVASLPKQVADRIEIDAKSGCWIWTGAKRGGSPREGHYGGLSVGGKQMYAHRYVYELLVGPIPHGLVVDHLCRVRRCVNPAHIEPVTERENLIRGNGVSGINSRRTHCAQGHEFTPENTHIDPRGHRRCRTCNRVYLARWHARRREGR